MKRNGMKNRGVN